LTGRNIAASIQAKLLKRAKADGVDFMLVLTRYALERILYRLSISKYSEQYLLKGALLFDLWFDIPHRPTRDADLLGFIPAELGELAQIFKEICEIEVEDGIVFDSSTIKIEEIRKEANYGGVRITFTGILDKARCPVQIDIGFGDAVTPEPESVSYPCYIDGIPVPKLKAYPRYTVVAEKFEAMVSLGMANSRLKDYFDIWVLLKNSKFEGSLLQEAIKATFERRKTTLPEGVPIGLSPEFYEDTGKQTQWNAFLNKNGLEQLELDDVINAITLFLVPIITAISESEIFEKNGQM